MSKSKPCPIETLINRYSSLDRLKKCVAWLIRCKHFLYLKVKNNDSKFDCSALSVDELQNAELCLIKYIQNREFFAIISSMTNDSLLKGSSSRYLLKLKPILVDGVLHIGGRLDKAPVDFSVWHPIILPSDSHFTELLILHHHQLVGYSGMGHTWASLRQSYWIVKGSVTVRWVIGNCVFCKKRSAPVGQQ